MTKRLLTGDRCNGVLHLGHYVGKLLPLLAALEQDYQGFVMIADYHALTTHYEDPQALRRFSREVALDYLAAGVDPKRHAVFIQSQVPEHLELAYLLGALTPVSHLERVPTYKEKLAEINDPPNFALLGYPVLMAADIIIYRGEAVPVGDDQLPHLEFTRETVRRFNRTYGFDFPEPQPVLSHISRLRGLDGQAKMSKSLHNQIDLRLTAGETADRIATMVTDPLRARRADPGRPEVCNVFAYYQAFAADEAEPAACECRAATRGCTACKQRLAERVNELLAPHRQRRSELTAQPELIEDVLADGGRRARAAARETLATVHDHLGFSHLTEVERPYVPRGLFV